jgi:hypothetical protein
MLVPGDLDALGANRRRRLVEVAAAHPNLRVLSDNFSAAEPPIIITKGDRSRLEVINRFISDVCASGLVKSPARRSRCRSDPR